MAVASIPVNHSLGATPPQRKRLTFYIKVHVGSCKIFLRVNLLKMQEKNSSLGYLKQTAEQSWMGVYLRILAIAIAYGALVHWANLAGFGEKPWSEMPLAWKVGDMAYAPLDTVTAIGLWQRTAWGIVCFLGASASHFLIYTAFIDRFAFTIEQRQTIYGLLGTEAMLLLVFIILLITKK